MELIVSICVLIVMIAAHVSQQQARRPRPFRCGGSSQGPEVAPRRLLIEEQESEQQHQGSRVSPFPFDASSFLGCLPEGLRGCNGWQLTPMAVAGARVVTEDDHGRGIVMGGGW
jgi:hypothetical protein